MNFISDKKKMSTISLAAAQKAAEANRKLHIIYVESTSSDEFMHALRNFLTEIYRP